MIQVAKLLEVKEIHYIRISNTPVQTAERSSFPFEQLHNMWELLGLIVDVERRAALAMAYLNHQPVIETLCCSRLMCFRCKITTNDRELHSCEEYQREQLSVEAQFCPSCGVATIKSEGCNHMICVCGANWHWGGGGGG
eukprot:COSAG01_NODE_38996_length_482_cov_1.101828_1_plen_138_part_10